MDTLIQQLRDNESITTKQAIETVVKVVERYKGVLSNIIAIKEKKPEGKGFLRGDERVSTNLFPDLLNALIALEEGLAKIEANFTMPVDHTLQEDREINRHILELLQQIIKQMHDIYQNKGKSFAVILTDLEALHAILASKLLIAVEKSIDVDDINELDREGKKQVISQGKKYVYGRIYHRAMEYLGTSKASSEWLPPLLEAVKDAERHGIAVYDNEKDVMRSLRGEKYGYVVLQIHEEQDVTAKRSPRKDPQLQCDLLTLTNVSLAQMIELVHLDKRYPIVAGKIQGVKGE